MVFVVDKAEPPRLYRVKDGDLGGISFEFADIQDGGTSVRSSYNYMAKALIQDLKAKMPIKVLTASLKICPSCGKEMMSGFNLCPYCGTKLK